MSSFFFGTFECSVLSPLSLIYCSVISSLCPWMRAHRKLVVSLLVYCVSRDRFSVPGHSLRLWRGNLLRMIALPSVSIGLGSSKSEAEAPRERTVLRRDSGRDDLVMKQNVLVGVSGAPGGPKVTMKSLASIPIDLAMGVK